jgi:hypothetical protein
VTDTLTPQEAPAHLCELSGDARAAVLLDASGEVAGSSEGGERGDRLAQAARELFEAVDAAVPGDPPEEVETQVDGGAVFLVRRGRLALAIVARRSALPSLMFYDARAVLSAVERAVA